MPKMITQNGSLWILLLLLFMMRTAFVQADDTRNGSAIGRDFTINGLPFDQWIDQVRNPPTKPTTTTTQKPKSVHDSFTEDRNRMFTIFICCGVGLTIIACCCAGCGYAARRRRYYGGGVGVGAPMMGGGVGVGMGYGMGVQPGYQQTTITTTTAASPTNNVQSSTPSQQGMQLSQA